MYQMLERYLPSGYMEKKEMDQKSILRSSWRKLSDYAEEVTDKLGDVQGKFKKQLIEDVRELMTDATLFREDYLNNGPMQSGLKPAMAVEALKRYSEQFEIRERKMKIYSAGQELFALTQTKYPQFTKTTQEL